MEDSIAYWALLVFLGLLAGIINTLAGGGSNLTLPALMITGMPADVANATNRVAVLLQNVVATQRFHRKGKLPLDDAKGILWPTILGGLVGAVVAAYAPVEILKPALLLTMLGMATLILVRPDTAIPPRGTI